VCAGWIVRLSHVLRRASRGARSWRPCGRAVGTLRIGRRCLGYGCRRDGASAAEAAAVVLGLGYTHGWSVPRVSPARTDSWTSRWRAQPPQQQIVNSPAVNKDIRHLFWGRYVRQDRAPCDFRDTAPGTISEISTELTPAIDRQFMFLAQTHHHPTSPIISIPCGCCNSTLAVVVSIGMHGIGLLRGVFIQHILSCPKFDSPSLRVVPVISTLSLQPQKVQVPEISEEKTGSKTQMQLRRHFLCSCRQVL
jgi:hypothetical protein